MANHLSVSSIAIDIPEALNEDGVTLYEVRIVIDDVSWSVKRRYREFSGKNKV